MVEWLRHVVYGRATDFQLTVASRHLPNIQIKSKSIIKLITLPMEGLIRFNHALVLDIYPFLSKIMVLHTLILSAMGCATAKQELVLLTEATICPIIFF